MEGGADTAVLVSNGDLTQAMALTSPTDFNNFQLEIKERKGKEKKRKGSRVQLRGQIKEQGG
jgi:hypothetical protein